MPEFCQLTQDDAIWTVTINRPEVMNAVHPPTNYELDEIFAGFEADPSARVAILTGAGDKAFCAGNDLKYLAEHRKVELPPTGFAGLTKNYSRTKPIIAAVNGLALGGGFEIALACDLIIAAESARFGLPEPRIGLAASGGGLHRLPRQLGLKHAMGMILTGRHVWAPEAFSLGFVNEVVAGEEVQSSARKWADAIVSCAPLAIATSMRIVGESLNTAEFPTAHENDAPHIEALRKSADAIEGPESFVEKRAPRWQGR
ncbi:MAG: enoyl-CoA hydratase-related protein [Pseudomonadota bacterium]